MTQSGQLVRPAAPQLRSHDLLFFWPNPDIYPNFLANQISIAIMVRFKRAGLGDAEIIGLCWGELGKYGPDLA
jgi:hypothetical protein